MYKLLNELYPICRSITGNGVRETLNIIKELIPISIYTIESETKVFDWEVPMEWNIKDAYIKNSKGEKIIDFKTHNLHILNYSIPFKKIISFTELKSHIFTLEEYPNWIPYRTSYYTKNWGFCMKHNDFLKLDKNDLYEVNIDSELKKGVLNYADLIIPGRTKKEILISCYICHPSMCNDSISGVAVSIYLAKYLLTTNNYYSYRFVFIPETIGSIVYLSKHLNELKENVIGGYVITCVGDEGEFTYLKTRKENQIVDKNTLFILENNDFKFKIRDYTTCGSDERQYNYPGVDLNIGSLMKSKYHEYPEYHTSADNLDFVSEKGLNDSFDMYKKCIDFIEINHYYRTTTICEPQLSKYNLYNNIGGITDTYEKNKISGHLISKFLKYCDGNHDLIDIIKIYKINIKIIKDLVELLIKNNLIINEYDTNRKMPNM
jgi:aminopeptidase-like protein